jgi:hypothetical protein
MYLQEALNEGFQLCHSQAGLTMATSGASQADIARSSASKYAGNRTVAITNARLAFYSIGESLDLARLDARVTDLINAFAVTIP